MKRFFYLPFALLILVTSCSPKKTGGWQELFNGKDLSGWKQVNGKALYEVKNNEIIGTTVMESPNSFLATDQFFGDFILELDFKTDSLSNSGIQLRSIADPAVMDGRMHGYQIEIDPSARAFTGGIYDEARRGWLYPLTLNPKASAAYNKNDWNHFRIQAIGDTIVTWLNGVPASWLVDSLTRKGLIALQVHNINGDTAKLGMHTWWKNIRIRTDSLQQYGIFGELGITEVNMIPNTLSGQELQEGWKLLFDGKTSNGWRGAYKDSFPSRGWHITDGMLCVDSANGGESTNGGDIVTMEQYSAFDLKVEFRLTKRANSGIKYYVTESEHNSGSAIGLEYQFLDDENHPDAKLGNHEGSRTLASLYDLIAAKNKRVNAIGEWNRAEIISDGRHVEHWLNGFKVLEYDRFNPAFRKLVSESKYKVWKNFGEAPKGFILLQDHGSEVYFRSIKIKVL